MDLVSVIIPYYRKKNFFKKTLNSVLSQTYSNIEIIIIYDDVNKSELIFLKDLINKSKKIHLIINNKNFGAGFSRNIGIKKSNGKFIAFIDADDVWKKEKLAKQIQFMKKNNFNASHTSYQVIDTFNNKNKIRVARNFNTQNDLIKSCDIGLSTVIIRRKILKGDLHFPCIKTKEDFVLWLKILGKNYSIYGLSLSLSYWLKDSHSLSSSIFQKIKDGFKVYNHYMKFNIIKSLMFLIILGVNSIGK